MAADPRSAPPPSPRLAVRPAYPDARSEIVRPDLVQVTTRYFWSRWAPKLGPSGVSLLLALRRRCYLNPETGERRDWCWPSQPELAQETGLSERTVRSGLAKLETMGFIRRQPRFAPAAATGGFGVSRRSDRISVLMVEPIAPEDEGRAAAIEAERLANGPDAWAQQQLPDPVSRLVAEGGKNCRHHARQNLPGNTLHFEEALTERSPLPPGTASVRRENDRTSHSHDTGPVADQRRDIVRELEDRLGDKASRGFFVLVARRLPHDVIREAVSQTLEARSRDLLRGSVAAYFTGIVKRCARERGVSLEARR